jgi:hypothetical protein
VWNSGHELTLELDLRTDFPETRVRKHFESLQQKFTYPSEIGVFECQSGGINVRVSTSDWLFELRVTRGVQK